MDDCQFGYITKFKISKISKKKKKNPVSSLAVEVSFFFLYLKKIITMVTCNRSKLTFTQNTSNWGWVDKFNTGEEMGCIRV